MILIAFAVNCGRIISVQRVYEPAFHRDADMRSNRKTWPTTLPEDNAMFGSNDRARWATIRSLVHDGTYVIGKRDPTLAAVALFGETDPFKAIVVYHAGAEFRTDVSNPLSHYGIIFEAGLKEHAWATIDRVMDPETLKFYSSKPPLLSTLLAGIYWVLYHVFGLSLIDNPTVVVRTMLILVNLLPFAGYLWLLTQIAERWGKTDWGKLYIVAAGAFATIVSPFLITLSNHTFGTFSVMLAWWSVLCVWDRIFLPCPGVPKEGSIAPWPHFVSAGFFASFAATNEMPALSFAVACFVLLAWWCPAANAAVVSCRRRSLPAVAFFATNYIAMGKLSAGAVGVRAETSGTNTRGATGSRRRPGYTKDGIDWAEAWHENRAQYAMHVLVGHHGLFTLTPIWILAVAGMIAGLLALPRSLAASAFQGGRRFPWFVQPLGLALTVVVTGFYLVKSDNYGGYTNGLRWLMWLTPIWLTCLLPMADRLAASKPGRWLAGLCLAISIFSVSYQLWSPWRHPWIFDLMVELGWPGY